MLDELWAKFEDRGWNDATKLQLLETFIAERPHTSLELLLFLGAVADEERLIEEATED